MEWRRWAGRRGRKQCHLEGRLHVMSSSWWKVWWLNSRIYVSMDIFLSYLGNGGLFASLAISDRQIPICIDATGKADLECTFLLPSNFLARNYCEGLTQQFSFFFFFCPTPQLWQQEQCTWNFLSSENLYHFWTESFHCCGWVKLWEPEMTLNHSPLIWKLVSSFPLSFNGIELLIKPVLILHETTVLLQCKRVVIKNAVLTNWTRRNWIYLPQRWLRLLMGCNTVIPMNYDCPAL